MSWTDIFLDDDEYLEKLQDEAYDEGFEVGQHDMRDESVQQAFDEGYDDGRNR